MTRIEYLKDRYGDNQIIESDYTILNSLINTLSPIDTCTYFDLTFKQNYHVRKFLLRKISYDISKNYEPEHKKLISSLIKLIDKKGFNKKESCSFSIDFLYETLPIRVKTKILDLFLTSKLNKIRNRAFKILDKYWNKKYQKRIEDIWILYKDTYCLNIILNHFSIEYLLKNYKEILKYSQPYQTSRLFLKLATIETEIVFELREIDQISYSYVLTKLNKKLTEIEASEFLKTNYKDERIGLLLWCYGKMGLWNNILEYDNIKKKTDY